MCGMPGCTTVPKTRKLVGMPGTRPVVLTHCPDCDTRTCGTVVGQTATGEAVKCTDRIVSPTATRCPRGHTL